MGLRYAKSERRMMAEIRIQFYPTCDGCRLLTYALYFDGVFVGYSRCWCRAVKAAEMLRLTLR